MTASACLVHCGGHAFGSVDLGAGPAVLHLHHAHQVQFAGGTCLEDIDRLRNDVPYMNGLGREADPGPDHDGGLPAPLHRGRTAHADGRDQLGTAEAVAGRGRDLLGEVAYVDVHGTIVPATGELKQGMDISYKGIWGYRRCWSRWPTPGRRCSWSTGRQRPQPSGRGAVDRQGDRPGLALPAAGVCAQVGRVDPSLLTEEIEGPRRLLLGGRSWQVTYIDWTRRRCFVEPVEAGGKARWTSRGISGLSYALSRAMREVLLGTDPPVKLTSRARHHLAEARDLLAGLACPDGTAIVRTANEVRWWTWAGYRANATLASTLSELADPKQDFEDHCVRLRDDITPVQWRAGAADAAERLCLPEVSEKALTGLKFSSALPTRLAEATLAARLADLPNAATVLREPVRFVHL